MAYEKSFIITHIREDLEKTEGKRDVVKANPIEMMMVKKVSPEELHVNPADEFSFPDIGPNDAVFEEPILVNKIKYGGYLILNGHHRWAGALKARVKKIRIKIQNP